MNKTSSYPKVFQFGHHAVDGMLGGTIHVQEKYDGSQFSFQWLGGELYARSKGKQQVGGDAVPDKMFQQGIDYLLTLGRMEDTPVFRAEYFNKPKHNTLAYPRMPLNGFILYDVELSAQRFESPAALGDWAALLDVEPAQSFGWYDVTPELGVLEALLERESSLGGPMEGIVVKNYDHFSKDGKVSMAKIVSPEFKEKHGSDWKARNPNKGDIVAQIVDALNTEARWQKAVQHLRDDGRLKGGPEDIGPLMKEVKRDTLEEEAEFIRDRAAAYVLGEVERALGRGLPDWYKRKLMEDAF